MGGDIAKFYHGALIVLAIIMTVIYLVYFMDTNKWFFILVFPALMLMFHVRRVMETTTEKAFDPELKVVSLTTFAASIFFAIAVFIEKM